MLLKFSSFVQCFLPKDVYRFTPNNNFTQINKIRFAKIIKHTNVSDKKNNLFFYQRGLNPSWAWMPPGCIDKKECSANSVSKTS